MSTLLTRGQRKIWQLRLEGLKPIDISREIAKSRQHVSKSLQSVDSKIYKAMVEAAEMNRVMIRTMDPEKGFLIGYSQEFQSKVLITFSPSRGIMVWRPHQGQCEQCPEKDSCRSHLLREADRLGVSINSREKNYPPAKLAGIIFTRAWPETDQTFEEVGT